MSVCRIITIGECTHIQCYNPTIMQSVFIAISTILALISPITYARAILRGEAKPHRTTRFTILLTTVIGTASLLAQHNTVAVWLAGVSALQAIFIFALSIKHGMGGWSKSDITCMVISIFGIILWKTTDNPLLALYASIIADFTGMIPALIKTYRFPETEVWYFYAMDTLAGAFSMAALSVWTLQEYSYPVYILLINAAMVVLSLRKSSK